MKSPFPGMDPYLEETTEWSGVHSRLINTISDELADRLAPAYIVKIEMRVHILAPDQERIQTIVPDVYVLRDPDRSLPTLEGAISAPTLIEPLFEPEIRERYIEIRDASGRNVVTTLEVLSPFNKAKGSIGRAAFMRKREAVFESQTHWIEIDLLRNGERPDRIEGRSDYYALLHRGGTFRPSELPSEAWFFDLRDRMPTIAVPLTRGVPDLPLDLQRMLDTVYARGHYADALDYSGPPPPPHLRVADATWAAARIAAWRAERATSASDAP